MTFTVTHVAIHSEWKSKYGKDMITYALQLREKDGWVQLNQMKSTKPPQVGDTLEGSVEEETNRGTGKVYYKFVKEFNNAPGGGPSGAANNAILERIEKKIDLLLANNKVEAEPEVVLGGENVDLPDDPFGDM